jgi:hypothetical protein
MAQTTNNPKGKEENRSDGGQMFDRAKDFAGEALQRGKDAAGPLAHKAGEAASMVGRKVDEATSAVGAGVANFADRLKGSVPHEGMLGHAAQSVADSIKEGGKYLQHEGFSGMTKDVGDLIKRNPVPAVLLGLGLGFLIGRMLRS